MVSNFQAFVEIILLYLLLFWEHSSIRLLVRKNLIAHRSKNKMSSVIYSVTLGAIIFLVVSSTLTLQQISAASNKFTEVDIYLKGATKETDDPNDLLTGQYLFANQTDPILLEYKDRIESFAYVSNTCAKQQNRKARFTISSLSRLTVDGKPASNLERDV